TSVGHGEEESLCLGPVLGGIEIHPLVAANFVADETAAVETVLVQHDGSSGDIHGAITVESRREILPGRDRRAVTGTERENTGLVGEVHPVGIVLRRDGSDCHDRVSLGTLEQANARIDFATLAKGTRRLEKADCIEAIPSLL